MKVIKNYLLFAFFAFILLTANVFAGDYARLNFIGFSKDGNFLAFEEYGTQDGSGFPYSNIFFVDTAKNSFAAAPIKIRLDNESATESAARVKAKTAVALNLRKFKIIVGNTGEMLVARLLTDLSADKISPGDANKNQFVKFTDYRVSNYYENEFELSLTTSKVKTKTCEYASDQVLKFDLTLKNTKANTLKILQSDKTLPETRNCPLAYSIQNVYVYQNRITVFLNVYTMGFEGPDMRFLSVAGIYK